MLVLEALYREQQQFKSLHRALILAGTTNIQASPDWNLDY